MEVLIEKMSSQIAFTNPAATPNFVVMENRTKDSRKVDLDAAVRDYYKDVYRFAYNLSRNAADAGDLTQYAYERLAMKWKQITDPSKVKGWLQSTLYRKFIDQKRRSTRFPEVELNEEWSSQSGDQVEAAEHMDAKAAVEALFELEDDLRAPLALFYLDACSYKEIASTLKVPLGTVMSRIYRGKTKLYQLLTSPTK